MVIVLGILRATSIQDLKFVRQNAEGQAPEEFTGEMKSQFGISESWVFTSRRLVELLKEGRDGKVSLTASTSSGPQAASEFLDVEITWPAPKSNEK